MKKRILWLILPLLLWTAVCSAAVSQADFSMGEISLFSHKDIDIIEKFGHAKKQMTDDQRQPPLDYFIYPGIRFGIVQPTGEIAFMSVDTGAYQTVRGIKVGGTVYKVVKEYGEPERQTIKGHRYYVYRLESDPTYRLMFDMSEGYVSRIILTKLSDLP
ncbi:hypothetical protein SDC9_206775 [bioreactor metagenome]|uniref:DUF4309 domain-containing protein n=1 Tax=bioreactor metagenome TaxID=1076179 RepID=A0A645J6N9_9ZZZZ